MTSSTVSNELPQVDTVAEPETVGVQAKNVSGAEAPPQLELKLFEPEVLP